MSKPEQGQLAKNFNHMAPGAEYDRVARNYNPIDLGFQYGEGSYLIDEDKRVYLDFIGGYGAVMFGHRHEKVVETIVRQVSSQPAVSEFLANYDFESGDRFEGEIKPGGLDLITRNFTYPLLAEYATKLAAFSRIEDAVVLPKNGGGEIIDSAVKGMRKDGEERRGIAAGEGKIIVFENNFHGRTHAAVAASTSDVVKGGFGPYLPGFIHVPYGDAEEFEKAMKDNVGLVAGVLIEPIQGEGGVIIPPEGFLKRVQELCKEHDAVLCLDEIQSGMGRTGKRWAWEHDLDEAPDMIVTAKALGAGTVAASALVGSREIMNAFTPGTDGATMSGSPLTCAVGLAAIEILEKENLCEASAKVGEHMMRGLAPLADHPMVKEIRVRGSWGAVELAGDTVEEAENLAVAVSNYLTTEMRIACTPAHGCIRLSPPINMDPKLVDIAAQRIVEAVREFEQRPELSKAFIFEPG